MLRLLTYFVFLLLIFVKPAFAATDPRDTPNNKFGINVLSPEAEIEEAKTLVNTNGDWGYVVVTITRNERDLHRWQNFLNQANKTHLIPIIRIATEFNSKNGYWERPKEEDAKDWAEFLSRLYFPTSNKYIQVYNEVNRSSEWGGEVDAPSYAKELEKTTNELKSKNSNFFVLNAPLDLALVTSENSVDAVSYYAQMEEAVPGIFKKLDGWASHSYPNPGFSSDPNKPGRLGIRGYDWELSQIASYAPDKNFSVFITETGWKREEGVLSEQDISAYYKEAFEKIWNDSRVVAVAPFLLGYPEELFNKFSFKIGNEKNKYYEYFHTIKDLPKTKGEPYREDGVSALSVFAPNYFIKSFGNYLTVNFKNTGNKIWDRGKGLRIRIQGSEDDYQVFWYKSEFYPGEDAQAIIRINSNSTGTRPLTIQVLNDEKVLGQTKIFVKSETTLSLFIQKLRSLI